MKIIALSSMLHEDAVTNSATRRFRGEPVLGWTLRRIDQTRHLHRSLILAWDDQVEAIIQAGVNARSCGPRRQNAALQATCAAQRWADGWRGGLLHTCWFDKGFVAPFVFEAVTEEAADAIVWIDPSAGLIDPALLDALVDAGASGTRDFYFTQAAPGLGGVLLKQNLLQQLAEDQALPGRLVHYLPSAPMLDPVTSDACVETPLPVSRTIDRFTLDSQRQIDRIEQATQSLNGTLITSESLSIVSRAITVPASGKFPRELVIELTARRATRPIFNPATHLKIDRPDINSGMLESIITQSAACDDVRITLAGVGDPLCHPQFAELLNALTPIAAVSIETDLIDASDERIKMLIDSGIDAIAIHLPAMQPSTYAHIMGIDAMASVVESIRRLVVYRKEIGNGVPLIVPIFQKLATNLDEMEIWYDTWLKALGSAVIRGPSRFGGRLPDLAAADMTPSKRKPCARIQQRLTILSDGWITMCDEDVTGEATLGHVSRDRIENIWTTAMGDIRQRHERMTALPLLCNNCREWDRP